VNDLPLQGISKSNKEFLLEALAECQMMGMICILSTSDIRLIAKGHEVSMRDLIKVIDKVGLKREQRELRSST